MKPPKCMGREFNKLCTNPGFFRIKDIQTCGEDGWTYYCDIHIGDHLARCVEGFEDSFDKVKDVTLGFV